MHCSLHLESGNARSLEVWTSNSFAAHAFCFLIYLLLSYLGLLIRFLTLSTMTEKKRYIEPTVVSSFFDLAQCVMIPESLPVKDDEVDIVGSKERDDEFSDEEIEFFINELDNSSESKNTLW